MKLLKFAVICICFAIVTLTPINIYAQFPSTDKLDKDFLGLYMGCSFNELQAQLKQSTNSMTFTNQKVIDGVTAYFYTGNHRLNGASHTIFCFWKGKLSMVVVRFETEEANKIYSVLKTKIENKYGSAMRNEIKFLGEKCYMKSDGMAFELEYEKKPFEIGFVMLTCIHSGISGALDAVDWKKKSKDLGDL